METVRDPEIFLTQIFWIFPRRLLFIFRKFIILDKGFKYNKISFINDESKKMALTQTNHK